MITSEKNLCSVPRLWLIALNLMLAVSLILNVIAAIGNWNLFARMERLESVLGLKAMPQSPQTPLKEMTK